jgi:hypothetical protein
MDQLKELIRQAIKYRFWIAIGISAVLPLIAYFLGSGPVQAQAKTKSEAIKAADTEVKKYTAGVPINKDYKPLVVEKTGELAKDVQNSWQKLYDQQKGLLKWPDRVHDRFTKWGRAWPAAEVADSSVVHSTITDYIEGYPAFVKDVYKCFQPFDPVDGKGVVAGPPEAELLQPSKFDIAKLPTYGKVWAAQERLWVQRALLEVVANVNKSARDWDGALVKQINLLNVGSSSAQDQRSIAKGEQAEKAPDIDDPSKPAPADAGGGGDASNPMAGMAAMYAKGGMGGMGMGAGAGGQSEDVYYIANPSTQFKIMPVQLSVLVEQGHIQDLLVALENSPMTIQVKDFEMTKPLSKVTKPEKGNAMNFGMYGGGGMMGMMENSMMRGAMSGMGGRYGNSMRSMMDSMSAMGGYSGMSGGMGGMGGMGAEAAKKGVDRHSENLAKKRADELKAVKSGGGNSLHDPYFNIVEVTVYGQARFFNPPPAEAPVEPSQAETAGAAAKEEVPKAEAKDATTKEEAPKTEPPKAEPPKPEAPKAEAPKTEASKAEPPKPEAPKAVAPKAEAPKAEAPKTEPAAPKL